MENMTPTDVTFDIMAAAATIGRNVRALRLDAKLSIEALATVSGLEITNIQMIECAEKRFIDLDEMNIICSALGCKMSEIIDGV
jgi:DNA-binding Xre family transcriptional regulator